MGRDRGLLDPELVGHIGRIPERSQFLKLPLSTKTRSHALEGSSVFVWDANHGAFVCAFVGDSGELEHMWAFSRDFIEIPIDLRPVRVVQHRLMQPDGCHCRMLLLGDNLGCMLSLSRSRAKDYFMLVQVVRVAAWCLARGVRITFRWTLSQRNTADDPNRLAEAAVIDDDVLEEMLLLPARSCGVRGSPECFAHHPVSSFESGLFFRRDGSLSV